MNILDRETILAAEDGAREYVELPEWGGGVYVKAISAKDGLEIVGQGAADGPSFMEKLLARAIVDEAGRPIFTEEDMPFVMEKPRAAVNRLMEAAMRVSGFGKIDEAEKN